MKCRCGRSRTALVAGTCMLGLYLCDVHAALLHMKTLSILLAGHRLLRQHRADDCRCPPRHCGPAGAGSVGKCGWVPPRNCGPAGAGSVGRCGRVCGAGMGRGDREAILILFLPRPFFLASSTSPATIPGGLTSLTCEILILPPHLPPRFRLRCERSAHRAQGKRAGRDPPLAGRVSYRWAYRPFTACKKGAAGGT